MEETDDQPRREEEAASASVQRRPGWTRTSIERRGAEKARRDEIFRLALPFYRCQLSAQVEDLADEHTQAEIREGWNDQLHCLV